MASRARSLGFHSLHSHCHFLRTETDERRESISERYVESIDKGKKPISNDIFKSTSDCFQFAVEAVGNIRTVVSLGCEKAFHATYVAALLPHLKRAKRNTHVRAFVLGLARSLMFFAFAACMYYGGILIRDDGLPYADVFK